MSPYRSSIIKFCNLTALLFFTVNAQNHFPKSGLFTILTPESSAAYVNSSVIESERPVIYPSSAAGDILMTPDSVKCASGIYTDTAFDKLLDFTEFQSISSQDICYYFDLLFKKKVICAPEDTYASAAPAGRKLYFFKTSKDRYGAILKIGQSYDENEKAFYYIVCSDSGSAVLYKKEPRFSLTAISITVNVFSGRPDPQFTINDSLSVNTIFESLVDIRYSKPDTSALLPIDTSMECGNIFMGTIYYTSQNIGASGSITLGNHSIFYSDSFGTSKIITPTAAVQKLLISIGRKENLSYEDEYGTVYFRDLFPECTSAVNGYGLRKDNLNAYALRGSLHIRCRSASYAIPLYTDKPFVNYSICTLQGRILRSGQLLPQKQILSLEDLKPGIYMCIPGNGSERKSTVFIAR